MDTVADAGPPPWVKAVGRLLSQLLVLTLAASVLASLVVLVALPRATQGAALTVLTGSMTPQIPVGSVAMIRPVDPATLQVGDVATYEKTPGTKVYITHRIVEIDSSDTPTRFIFKGDANRTPDSRPVLSKQIRGEVWFHVPYLGSIRDGLHGRGGITLWATLLLAAYALMQFGAGMRERREGRSSKPSGIVVNTTLIVASMDRDRLALLTGQTPAELAASWSALLVHEDETSCTVVLAPIKGGVETALDVVHQVQPLAVRIIDEPGTLTGLAARPVTLTRPGAARVEA